MKTSLLTLFAALVIGWSAVAQEFSYHSIAPFGIDTISTGDFAIAPTIQFYDYEGDGDLDLFFTALDNIEDVDPLEWEHIHFYIDMQENTGTRHAPQFGERTRISEYFPYPVGYFFAAPGDLNQDGLIDFMTSAHIDFIGNQKLRWLRNTGLPGKDQFEVNTLEWMGIIDFVPESFFMPHLVDLDLDGDLDLLVSGFDPAFAVEDGPDVSAIYYARNIGTKNEPNFQGWYPNPYELSPDTIPELMTSGDIDLDGDIDFIGSIVLIPADSVSYINVHINTPGPDQKPAFTDIVQSPFGFPAVSGDQQLMSPRLADLDGDGDLDMFVFKGTATINVLEYYENDLCQVTTTEVAFTICEGESLKYNGESYTAAGHYVFHFTDAQRCDSIVHLELTIDPLATSFVDATICEGESYTIGDDTFTEPGAYMVFVVGSNGCDSIINLTLTVDASSSSEIEASICAGESYLVGSDVFTEAGAYSVVLTAANGCDSIVILTLQVHTVDPNIALTEQTLTASQGGASYQWIDCDSGQNIAGAVNQSYEVTTTGNYAVIITTNEGCAAQSECINVTITSTGDKLESGLISLYPNPANGKVYILNHTAHQINAVTLINTLGQVVLESKVGSDMQVDVSDVKPGAYIMHLSGSGYSKTMRLIIF